MAEEKLKGGQCYEPMKSRAPAYDFYEKTKIF